MADDYPPPWIALPDLRPTDSTNQGLAEAYITLSWLPFWQTLSREEKDRYLDHWNASPEWRTAIADAYDWDEAAMAADAAESEAYLAEWRAARAERRPWWRFWR